MSGQAIASAERHVLPNAHALVLRAIASSINPRLGRGWKAQSTLAVASNGLSLSTLKWCLEDLEALELVAVGRVDVHGRRRVVYRVNETRFVRWERKSETWWTLLAREGERLANARALPNETKQDFVDRITRRKSLK